MIRDLLKTVSDKWVGPGRRPEKVVSGSYDCANASRYEHLEISKRQKEYLPFYNP